MMPRACIFFFIISIVYVNGQSDRKSSLTFVIDVTRSMETVRRQVEQHAYAIFDTVMASNESYIDNFVLVTFADIDKYKTSVNNVTDTKNRDEFKDSLKLKLVSGGDCPEYSMSGILTGIENSAPRSTIYVFTDAFAKDYKLYEYVKDKAQKKEIQVVFILTGKCDSSKYDSKGYDVYEHLARDTSGQVINLLKTSVGEIIKFIKDNIAARRIYLGGKFFPPGKGHTLNYTTDHATTNTTISISCFGITLKISGPDKNKLDVTNLVKLENIMVLKVNETKLGVQTVTFNCKSDSRIIVKAKSDIQFRHGFSAFIPTSLNDTTVKPSPDGQTYLLIKVMGNFLPKTVHFLDESDELILGAMPLKALDDTQKLFLTDNFYTPFIMFRIVVTGVNLDGNETITRIGSTLVEPQIPGTDDTPQRKPTIAIEGGAKISVEVDSPLQLKCTVSAYPKPTITWEKNGKILETDVFDYDLPYVYVSVHKIVKVNENATYECKAGNIKGVDKQSVAVETKLKTIEKLAEAPIIEKLTTILQIDEGTDVNISCSIEQGIPKPSIHWYYKDKVSSIFAELKEAENQEILSLATVNRTQHGIYKCNATNIMGSDTLESTLEVEYAPTVGGDSEPITVEAGEEVTLTCSADGVPDPVVIWSKDGKLLIGSKFVSSSDYRLIFKPDLDDSGAYTCDASNKLGSDSKVVRVEVEKSPRLLIMESDPYDAEYDMPLNITCEVFGYPKPDIVWLNVTSKAELEADVEKKNPHQFISYLSIDKITSNATYQCKANNTLGYDKKTIAVRTVRKPFFDVLDSPKDMTYDVAYNTEAKFFCKADAYPPAEVNWYKNGDILSKDDISVSSDGFVLTIKHMQPNDTGTFKCEIKNIHHNKQYLFKIKISGVAEPKISAFPKSVYVPENSPTNINCRIEQGIPKPSIHWYYKDKVSSIFAELKEAENQEILSLATVNRTQHGIYKCNATNIMGSDTLESTLEVEYAPTVGGDSEPITVEAGEEVTLTCSADGVPDPVVIWSKDGKPLIGSKFVSSSDYHLIFKPDLDDSGAYTCDASNKLGSDSKVVRVEVEKSPRLLIMESDPYDAEYDMPLNITCEVFGYPKPDIVWLNVTSKAELEADVEEKNPHQFISYLSIDKITSNATYQCKANNTLGYDKKTIAVRTVRKPFFDVLDSPKDMTYDVAYNTEAKFFCKADAYPPAEVNWYKNGDILSKDDISVSSDGFVLTIKHMQPNDTGTFKCEIKNIHHNKQYLFKIKISGVAEPKISAFPKSVYVPENSPTNINCRIEQGIPKPSIHWYYKDKVSSIFAELKEAENQEILSLATVNRTQHGIYKCNATNIMGSDTLESTLEVEYAPTVGGDSEPIIVEAGEEVTLTCSADGVPDPVVIWSKDGKPLIGSKFVSSSDYRLIFKPDLDDSGAYTCDASNKLGSDSKVVRVEVEKSPRLLIMESDPYDAEYDMPLNITCEVFGYPKPDIVWLNVTSKAELEADVEEKNPHQFISYLSIDKITSNATYQCKANNTLGYDKKTIAVRTVRKPFFDVLDSPKDMTYDVAYNTEAKFFCKADAYPPAEVNWYKNGDILSKDDISVSSDGFVLTIKHMQPNDTGTFKCEIKNIHHNKQYLFKIKISGVAEPKISAFPKSVYVPENSPTNINCRIEQGIPKPSIHWYYKDKVSSIFAELKEAENQEILSLATVNRTQHGIYKCNATNIMGSDTLESTLEVEYAPTVGGDSEPIIVEAGEEVTLTCSADGVPDPVVIWSKDGKPLIGSKFVSSSDYRLIFKPDLDDSGAYTCDASNKLGSDSKVVRVEVEKSPRLLIMESDPYDAEYDMPLNITCEVFGYPKPDIVWLNVTSKAELEADVEEKNPHQFISYLSIDKITSNATYQCKANNTLGYDKKTIAVRTVRKPFFDVLDSPKDMTYDVAYNTEAKFFCKADAYPPAEVNWYKNGDILSKDDISVSSDGFVLTIKHMQPNDTGTFKCEIKNIHHNKQYLFKIKISGVAEPKISAFPKSVYVPENSPTNINCRIEQGIPKPSIHWYYKDKVSSIFAELKEAENQEILSLATVNRTQHGIYKCNATNIMGSDTLESTLEVEYAPTVGGDSEPIIVEAGEEVTLTCSADGVPDPVVIWSKDGKPLIGSKFVSSSDYRLIFKPDLDDSGAYTCDASNKLGSDSKVVRVEVEKSPRLLIMESDPYDAEYDMPLNITCEVFGYPKPDIVWLNVTSKAELEADVEEKNPHQFISYLSIDKITSNATYQCKANNTLGYDKKTIAVRTVRKPFFDVLDSPKDMTYDVAYNTEAKFFCKADAYPPAEVNWYKNGDILSKDDISVSSDGFVLTIKHMQPNDTGTFKCEIKNIHHNKQYLFKIKISGVAEPKISAFPKSVYVPENSPTNINCRIEQGIPKPSIHWYYKDKVSSIFAELKEAENQEILSLATVNRTQHGIYKCNATNIMGSDTLESTLEVEYAPTVGGDSEPITVEAGEEVTLTCSADGVPDPVVIWSKDGKPLIGSKFVSSSDYRLIFKPDLDDSGAYTCDASNKLGSDSKVVRVEVEKSPRLLIMESDPYDAEYDMPLNITCEVFGYPKPDIVWLNVTSKAELEADVEEKNPHQFISYLSIDKITSNATYQCKANNTLGYDKKTIAVRTVRKPFFDVLDSPKDMTYDVAYNTEAKFFCKADAYPPAEVNWYKNGDILSKDDISVSSDGFVLTIKHMQPNDTGTFKCEIKNIHHNKQYLFKIKISGVAEPKISAFPKSVYVPENSPTNINCRIEQGIPKPSIHWYYKDKVSSIFAELKEAENQEILSLATVNRTQHGIYKCNATNIMGSDTLESTLEVEYAPTVGGDSEPIIVEAGEEVTLTCSADGVPDPVVIWSKDGKPLIGSKFVSSSDYRLIFKPDLDDSGAYTCDASNKLGSDSKVVRVEVEKSPRLLIMESDPYDAEYDMPLNITCEVFGYPKPDIVWLNVTSKAELEADVEEKNPHQFISYLSIDKITSNATYQCKANNTLGYDKKTIAVRTVRKPFFDVLDSPKDMTYDVAYNTEAKFFCKADAYPPAEVNWYKNGDILSKDDISVSSDGFVLTIKHMQPNDTGTFKCEIKNIHHNKQYLFKIKISGVAEPKISAFPKSVYVPENSPTNINCRIEQGIPKPSIHWYYKDKVSSIFAELKEAENQEILSLATVNRTQHGIYKCNATNIMGSDTLESTLEVEYAPTVGGDSEPITVEAGEEVTLTCSADGVPDPVVIWSKDGKPLIGSKFVSSNDYRLTFKPDLDDSGAYTCDASNKLGSDSKVVRVEVEKSPRLLIMESDPYDAEYDMPLNITCEVFGYPKPDIVWLNVTSKAELEADVEEKNPHQFISYLSIDKITSNATYQCKANNTLGYDKKTIAVRTMRKPYFDVLDSPKDMTYDVAYNTEAKFFCKADAYPPAEVNWYKNGDILSKDDISVSSDGFVLTIKHMQPNDTGTFKCEIKNIHHNKQYLFKIKISGVAEPKIDAFSKYLYIFEKSDTKINCRIEEGTPKPNIEWYFKDKATNIFVEIIEAKDQENLSLININRKDQGTYKCLATNVAGSDEMETELVVEYPPTIINATETMTVLAGSEVILICLADGFPTPDVKWTKADEPVTDSKFNIDLDDRGVYKCRASNKLGTAIKNVTIEVEKLPKATIEGDLKQEIDFNEALYLKCNVIGNPPPDIRWIDTTNRIILSGSTSTVKFPYEYLSILSIDKVNKNAVYQCEAKNPHGEDKASVIVEVVIKKHLYVTEEPKDTIVAYNTEGKLYCKVDAYPPAKITWLFQKPSDSGRSRLSNKDGVKISSDGSTLTFRNMQPNQEGIYFCNANNIDYDKTTTANVTISGLEIPKIYKTHKDKILEEYPVEEGTIVFLTCKIIKGIPKPTIKWHFKNKYSRKFMEIQTAKNRETLLVKGVHRNDNAIYACQADNIMGSDSLKMVLQVEYPPTIKDDKESYIVKAGEEVNIPCSVDGKPEPSVKWTKDSGISKFAPTVDHSFRLITNTGDSGKYICTATNKYGTVTRNVSLDVYSIGIKHKGKKIQTLDEYDILNLKCNGVGKPKPKMKWFFESTAEKTKLPPEVLLYDSNELEIDGIKFDQRGLYTCVAYNNMGGSANFTYEVDVYSEVKIHNRNHIMIAVDGDKALRIHCNATGNPKPRYNWVINGAPSDVTDDTIFLKDVNKKHDLSEVHCEAVNDEDSRDRFVFKVFVQDYPSIFTPLDNEPLKKEIGTGFPVTCPIPHKKGDYLRWYKNKKKILEGELYIHDAKISDSGLYTCRVSNLTKAESANVILKVGSKLQFMNTVVKTYHSLGLGESANLDCVAVGDPIPKISWYLNGKLISTKALYKLNMDQAKVGKYKCEATNDFDSISRTFDITLSECLLKIDSSAKKQPLISTQHFSWPSYKYDAGYLYMPQNQTVLLICQSTSKLNLFDYNFVYAYCNKTGNTAQLHIDEIPYDYSDLQCSEEIKPMEKWTKNTCLGDDSEKVKIVYEVLSKTIDVYEVCMDLSYDIPFYTKQNLNLPLADSVPKAVTWFNDRLYRYDFDKLYDVQEQILGISRLMRRPFHHIDKCAFSKKQLVNPLDVFPGLPQRATFTHMNVVPHWSTCSSKNWDDVESRVRRLTQSIGDELIVWTGTAGKLKLVDSFRSSIDISIINQADATSLPVSTYLWKVVQNPNKRASIAIIQLNIPDITKTKAKKYVKCKDICPHVNWMSGTQWTDVSRGYTFCCWLRDFKDKFGYPDLFGTGMDNLLHQ